MWQLWLIPAITVLYDVRQTLPRRVSAIQTVGPACWQGPTFTQVTNLPEASILEATATGKDLGEVQTVEWGMIQELRPEYYYHSR